MSEVPESQIQFATVLIRVLQWFPGALEPDLVAFSGTHRDFQGLTLGSAWLRKFCWFHVGLVNTYSFF